VFVFLCQPVFAVWIEDSSVYTSRNGHKTAGSGFDQGEWVD